MQLLLDVLFTHVVLAISGCILVSSVCKAIRSDDYPTVPFVLNAAYILETYRFGFWLGKLHWFQNVQKYKNDYS